MPTSVQIQSAEAQQREIARGRALLETVTVAAFYTPAGLFEIRRTPAGYSLSGAGLVLFGMLDRFDPDVTLHAVDDADAVRSAQNLILNRWQLELHEMERAFAADDTAELPAVATRADTEAEAAALA